MADGGHSAVNFKMSAAFAAVIDGLAKRRGMNRSEFLRQLVAEEALRLAEAERADA